MLRFQPDEPQFFFFRRPWIASWLYITDGSGGAGYGCYHAKASAQMTVCGVRKRPGKGRLRANQRVVAGFSPRLSRQRETKEIGSRPTYTKGNVPDAGQNGRQPSADESEAEVASVRHRNLFLFSARPGVRTAGFLARTLSRADERFWHHSGCPSHKACARIPNGRWRDCLEGVTSPIQSRQLCATAATELNRAWDVDDPVLLLASAGPSDDYCHSPKASQFAASSG